jgi:hypothetical protein
MFILRLNIRRTRLKTMTLGLVVKRASAPMAKARPRTFIYVLKIRV